MSVDRRLRNREWNLLDEAGNWYQGSYGGASLGVLMDIRDELQRLNALLHCENFTQIPTTLRGIKRGLAPRKKKAVKR